MSAKQEQEYFDALRKIAEFRPSEWFEEHAEDEYGLLPVEALEMAYDNMQIIAKNATRGRKRPEVKERP